MSRYLLLGIVCVYLRVCKFVENCGLFLEFRTCDDIQTDRSDHQYVFNGVLCTSKKYACALACTYVLTIIMEGMYSTYIRTHHQQFQFFILHLISFPQYPDASFEWRSAIFKKIMAIIETAESNIVSIIPEITRLL